jgi:hypothetical protein
VHPHPIKKDGGSIGQICPKSDSFCSFSHFLKVWFHASDLFHVEYWNFIGFSKKDS